MTSGAFPCREAAAKSGPAYHIDCSLGERIVRNDEVVGSTANHIKSVFGLSTRYKNFFADRAGLSTLFRTGQAEKRARTGRRRGTYYDEVTLHQLCGYGRCHCLKVENSWFGEPTLLFR